MDSFTQALANLRQQRLGQESMDGDYSPDGLNQLLRHRQQELEWFRGLSATGQVYLASLLARVNLILLGEAGTISEMPHWAGFGGHHSISYCLTWRDGDTRNITLTVYTDRMVSGQFNGDPPTQLISVDSYRVVQFFEQWLIEVLTQITVNEIGQIVCRQSVQCE
ncbi:hypothetical protein HGA91_05500 [candidate division WWE3 bacterium]|nr:hypothetical protein [candidate division WWE3 bacterium]